MALFPNWNISDLKELIKKGLTIEAEEKIMELRESLISLQEEKINLQEENKKLKEQKNISDNIIWESPYYLLKTDNNKIKRNEPYCQLCYDKEKILIRLQGGNYSPGGNCIMYNCPNCKTTYYK